MSKITIAKVDLSSEGSIFLELQKIYGIGPFLAFSCCKHLGVHPSITLGELDFDEIELLDEFIDNFFYTGVDLHKKNYMIKKKYIELKTLKGWRYKLSLN